jgi:hypothetical protein
MEPTHSHPSESTKKNKVKLKKSKSDTTSNTKFVVSINQKFVEIIAYLLTEQNRQLLKIISEEECIPLDKLNDTYLKSRQQVYTDIHKYATETYHN